MDFNSSTSAASSCVNNVQVEGPQQPEDDNEGDLEETPSRDYFLPESSAKALMQTNAVSNTGASSTDNIGK